MKNLTIKNKTLKYPIIQGGMGVGVSLSNLAGAVAKAGGVGIISTAQIGFNKEGFDINPLETNLLAIKEHIQKAKDISDGNGLIGVNVMVALKDYELHVKEAAKAGADIIISGAGIPITLPAIVKEYDIAIAPIVSSLKAIRVITEIWQKKYSRLPDLVIIEGPKAGGHLGYSHEYLCSKSNSYSDFDSEITAIIEYVNDISRKYNKDIPVICAGGIYDKNDIEHVMDLGASGVQIASRFVCTYECDASDAYKNAYLNAHESDVCIIKSPVGMPGRALKNAFINHISKENYPVKKCRGCLAKCNPAQIPYCITDALIRAVNGDTDNGLVFCGSNIGKIDKIMSVSELLYELTGIK